jgi:hypothetical protein
MLSTRYVKLVCAVRSTSQLRFSNWISSLLNKRVSFGLKPRSDV